MRILILLFIFTALLDNYCFPQYDDTEALVLSTIKINCFSDTIIDGKKISSSYSGTGFFFVYFFPKDTILVLVTNKHVIKNCLRGSFNFRGLSLLLSEEKNYITHVKYSLLDFESHWIEHETQDLAILPLAPIFKDLNVSENLSPLYGYYSEDHIPTQDKITDVKAIEDVLMIGYPKGLNDDINDLPIVRKGITATPFKVDYKNNLQFLLDIAIYPGSSGSPVIFKSGINDNFSQIYTKRKLFLLGIASKSINFPVKGEAFTSDTATHQNVNFILPIDIAVVIKSSCLLDFKQDKYHLNQENNRFNKMKN
jgi:hypothetical protein